MVLKAVTMKKIFFSFLTASLLITACSENQEQKSEPAVNDGPANEEVDKATLGKSTFESQCRLCHGDDGKLGASGAKDLTVSTLSHQDAINVVSYGRGGMMAYKDLLTKEQIENVVAYIETLRKK
jgi:mono/diheme cytochrome c family protein